MFNIKLFLVSVIGVLLLTGCSSEDLLSPAPKTELGSAKVNIQIGRIGQLNKVRNIVLSKLYIRLCASGEVTINDTADLISNGGTMFMKTYNDLASLKAWTLYAVSTDVEGQIIHMGSEVFNVEPRKTVPVNLNINSKFSMLKVILYPVRDSVTRCELLVNGNKMDDSSFIKQALKGDTIQLSYNYLDTGVSQQVRLNVYGDMWGEEYLLYTGDTIVIPVSGKNQNYSIILNWVGPSVPPTGQANMSVALGDIGTEFINAYIDPPYQFYKFVINSVGFGCYNPCLTETHFLIGDTIYPKSSNYTIISNSAVSAGTVDCLFNGGTTANSGYLKPLGGTVPWQWIVDMHRAYTFTGFYIYCWEVGFYGVPTSVTIYGGDSATGPWNVIGNSTYTQSYTSVTIPLFY